MHSPASAACPSTVARGLSPCSFAQDSATTIIDAAPSLTPGALPAVTVDSGSKAGFRRASASAVLSARGASSVSTVVTCPLRPWISTGTISFAIRPDSIAAIAR